MAFLSLILPHSDLQEQERSDLLEQYRALSLDAERFETQTHQLESEMSNLRLELMTKDSEVRRYREKIDAQEREIKDVSLNFLDIPY